METIKLDLIPGKKMPSLHASQYDDGRDYHIDLTENRVPYTLDGTETISLTVRKCDNTLVTMDIANVFGGKSYIEFRTTEQMNACAGFNYGEIVLEENGTRIGSLNFYLQVEGAPDEGGIQSQSEINNLNRQIDDYLDETLPDVLDDDVPPIVERVIDETLAPVAKSGNYNDLENKPSIPAAQVNSDWNSNSGVSQILNKPNLSTVATTGNYDDLNNKPSIPVIDDTTEVNNKVWSSKKTFDEIVNILPTGNASGSIASFNTSVSSPLVSCIVDESATKVTKCGVNIFDEQMELGGIYSANGQPYASTNRMRSKNYIKVEGGEAIYFYLGGAGILAVLCCYNENKEYIGDIGYDKQNSVISIPNNAKYIRFQMSTNYGTTYGNDISVCYPADNHSYSAYSGVDYPVADVDEIVANNGINNIFADVGDVSVSYRVSLDETLSEKADANIDKEDLSFSDVTVGKYVTFSGEVANSASFAYTKPINVVKGDTIIFEACGYQTNVSMIAKFNGTTYTPLVISVDSTVRTYTYIATENMSISLSYNTTEVHSATLKRNLMTGIDNLNNEVEVLKNKDQNLFSIFETFGACGDSLISGAIEVASGIIDEAVTNYNLSWAKQISYLCHNDCEHYSRGGLTTKAWLTRYESTIASKDAYFVALGTNDFNYLSLGTSADIGTSADTFYRYYGDIISLLKTTNPNASIFVCSFYVRDTNKTDWNNAIKYFADNNSNVYYVDLTEMTTKYGKYKNGSHFSAVGYKLIALDVLSELDEIIINNWSDFRYAGTYS